MEENEEITKFISTLESKSMEEETNIISLLEKANKYIIILNKSITERISKIKELYSPYFPELPTIVTNSYEYVQSIKVIEENKSLLTSDTKSGIKQLKQNLSFLPNNVLMALTFMSIYSIKSGNSHISFQIYNESHNIRPITDFIYTGSFENIEKIISNYRNNTTKIKSK